MSPTGIIYIRLPTKIGKVPEGEAFVDGAKALLEVDEKVLSGIVEDLASFAGFLSEASMKKIILHRLGDEKLASQVAGTIAAADVLTREGGNLDKILERLDQKQRSAEGQEQSLSPAAFARLRHIFHLLGRSCPGRDRQAKAERLAEGVGLRAEAIDLICDVRPVFDDERSKVEGFIPLTTLRVVASGVDKIPLSFEVVLAARDVQELLAKAEAAVKKLNVLGELAERNSLPVPAIDLTETRK
ncbi:MAG TPA: hypothetical protein VN688_33450 [Gemmataceae bacterium]|nr:hypothetical protein [Gemmataceae bacterium]